MADEPNNALWRVLDSVFRDVFSEIEDGQRHYDRLIALVEPAVMSNISMSDAGQPLERQTWKQLYEREHEQRVEGDKWRTLVADLDRCEHGRHEGDVCGGTSGCNGPSEGNPLLQAESYIGRERIMRRFGHDGSKVPARLIGFTMSGKPICVPTRDRLFEISRSGRPLSADDYVSDERPSRGEFDA